MDAHCASTEDGEGDCASGFVDGVSVSQCQIRVSGQEGDSPCVATREGNTIFGSSGEGVPLLGYVCDVADGLYCDGTSCVPLVAVGDACGGTEECVRTAYCEVDTCSARLPAGAECSGNGEECREGHYCDSLGYVCAELGGHGAACELDEQCRSEACDGGACVGDDDLLLRIVCSEPT